MALIQGKGSAGSDSSGSDGGAGDSDVPEDIPEENLPRETPGGSDGSDFSGSDGGSTGLVTPDPEDVIGKRSGDSDVSPPSSGDGPAGGEQIQKEPEPDLPSKNSGKDDTSWENIGADEPETEKGISPGDRTPGSGDHIQDDFKTDLGDEDEYQEMPDEIPEDVGPSREELENLSENVESYRQRKKRYRESSESFEKKYSNYSSIVSDESLSDEEKRKKLRQLDQEEIPSEAELENISSQFENVQEMERRLSSKRESLGIVREAGEPQPFLAVDVRDGELMGATRDNLLVKKETGEGVEYELGKHPVEVSESEQDVLRSMGMDTSTIDELQDVSSLVTPVESEEGTSLRLDKNVEDLSESEKKELKEVGFEFEKSEKDYGRYGSYVQNLYESADKFREQYEHLPGATEDVIAGLASAGAGVVSAPGQITGATPSNISVIQGEDTPNYLKAGYVGGSVLGSYLVGSGAGRAGGHLVSSAASKFSAPSSLKSVSKIAGGFVSKHPKAAYVASLAPEAVFEGPKLYKTGKKHGFVSPEFASEAARVGAVEAGVGLGFKKGVETDAKLGYQKATTRAEYDIDEDVAYEGIVFRQGRESQPLLGVTDEGVTFGTPDVEDVEDAYRPALEHYEGHLPKNPTERTIAKQFVEDDTLTDILAQRARTYGADAPVDPSLEDLPFDEVARGAGLPEDEFADVTKKAIKEADEAEVMGSASQYAQSGKFRNPRLPHDIDIKVSNQEEFGQRVYDELKNVKGVDEADLILGEGGSVEYKGSHLFDVHSLEASTSYGSGDSVTLGDVFAQRGSYRGYGFKPEESIDLADDITAESLSEQATGKMEGIGRIRTGGTFGPPEHRTKDIGDWLMAERALMGEGADVEDLEDIARSLSEDYDVSEEVMDFVSKGKVGDDVEDFLKSSKMKYYSSRSSDISSPSFGSSGLSGSVSSVASPSPSVSKSSFAGSSFSSPSISSPSVSSPSISSVSLSPPSVSSPSESLSNVSSPSVSSPSISSPSVSSPSYSSPSVSSPSYSSPSWKEDLEIESDFGLEEKEPSPEIFEFDVREHDIGNILKGLVGESKPSSGSKNVDESFEEDFDWVV